MSKKSHAMPDDLERAIVKLVSPFRPEELGGFALATDDGLETLLAYAITVRELADAGDPELLFQPTDWPHELTDNDLYQVAFEVFRECSHGERDSKIMIENRFSILVQALKSLRHKGAFPREVYLTILSTDPGEHLERLEDQAVVTLNEERLVTGWRAFLLKWQ